MHTYDALGATTASFVCGSSGTCTGSTRATQEAFIALQTQINRVGVSYGITKIATDGKIGPLTLRAMTNLARGLAAKLGGNLDPIVEELIIEDPTHPVTTADLAINAERLAAALQRDGTRAETWGPLNTIREIAQQIVAAGGAAPQVPPISAGVPLDPYRSTTVPQPPATPYPATAPNLWAYVPPTSGQSPAPYITALPRLSPLWIAIGVGALALFGGVVAAVARR
jgi:hypothetical protein